VCPQVELEGEVARLTQALAQQQASHKELQLQLDALQAVCADRQRALQAAAEAQKSLQTSKAAASSRAATLAAANAGMYVCVAYTSNRQSRPGLLGPADC
jgi:chromosome segregation ATPase